MNKQEFINAGFNVVNDTTSNNENLLLDFIKQNYPQIIHDGEVRLDELKSALGLPVDEKVNGYGLNFIGRNVAKGKYRKETDKVLKINTQFSRDFDNTQNLILKGDNLDSLKILKSYYNGQIKCIYIDPPYNTDSDNFVYPDQFDKEEAEVLGLVGLSETDMDRLEFSFRSKKSHNGWLTFMYPRLMLARELLSKDGVIFVSIDDNEQANLKLLMDDVFGEENFLVQNIWVSGRTSSAHFTHAHEYILGYAKNKSILPLFVFNGEDSSISDRTIKKPSVKNPLSNISFPAGIDFESDDQIFPNKFGDKEPIEVIEGVFQCENRKLKNPVTLRAAWAMRDMITNWLNGNEVTDQKGQVVSRFFFKSNGVLQYEKIKGTAHPNSVISGITTKQGTNIISELFGVNELFNFPKPIDLLKHFIKLTAPNDIILDFFAGSGTTAHAVMQLNAEEDGSNRKFILCQIDELINKGKPAYKFCVENNLPPVISSITCERVKRAGNKIQKEIEEQNAKTGLFDENKKEILDIGFKVFDLTDAPKLAMENGQVGLFDNAELIPLDRIYNLIFKVGIDNPTIAPTEIVKDCIYHYGANYYIANAAELDKPGNRELFKAALQNGKVYIDGWTATLNATLQETKDKEDKGKISIVF